MKKYLFTAVLLFSCTLAFNQTRHSRLSGKVTDERGEAIIGATVKLMQLDKLIRGTITDYNGVFFLKEIEQGKYDLVVSYTGYPTKRVEKVALKANMVHQLDVVLESPDNGFFLVCPVFRVPIIDIQPGNTGIIYPANFLRNMY